MKTVIEMAQEAGFETMLRKGRICGFDRDGDYTEEIEALAELVRADERARMAEQPAQQEPVARDDADIYGFWARNKEAEQPARQEPVAWEYCEEIYAESNPALNDYIRANGIPLYTSPPAQQEQVADKHQAFIDSLPSDMEDKMFEQIHYWARQSYARHRRSTRGQTITAADSSDNHIIWAALRWAKENAATPQAQPAQRPWVGLTEQEAAECWSTSTVRTWKAIEAKLKEKNT